MIELVGVELKDLILGFLEALMEADELLEKYLREYSVENGVVEVGEVKIPWIHTWYSIGEVELHLRGLLLSSGEGSQDKPTLTYCASNALTTNLYGFKDEEISELRIKFSKIPLIKHYGEGS
jgi:hypothetical protein